MTLLQTLLIMFCFAVAILFVANLDRFFDYGRAEGYVATFKEFMTAGVVFGLIVVFLIWIVAR